MKEVKDIRDDQIRIIGEGVVRKSMPRWVWAVISVLVLAAMGIVYLLLLKHSDEQMLITETSEPALFEPMAEPKLISLQRIGSEVDSLQTGYTEIIDTLVNDIPIRIYIPHNAELSLHIGKVDKADKSIIYVAQNRSLSAVIILP